MDTMEVVSEFTKLDDVKGEGESKVRWLGFHPENCDICNLPFDDEFVDGRTVMGPWAILCIKCFNQIGTGLGTGRGQRFVKAENGKFHKVEG